jgi:oxygen-independent coproporphyrinogen-3 oxidase
MLAIHCTGHHESFAVEQCALNYFPRDMNGTVHSRLDNRDDSWISVTKIDIGTRSGTGRICRKLKPSLSVIESERFRRELIRESFYRAALPLLSNKPPWGSLCGVKPAKVASRMLMDGLPPRRVFKVLQSRYHLSSERAALCLSAAAASEACEKTLAEQDILLYVSIPFCPSRCRYCSFVSKSTEHESKLIEPYLMALYREIEQKRGLKPAGLYIGGGTPTVLSPPQLDALLSKLSRSFDLSALREYTVEAGRPDTCSQEKLRILRSHGVTRVSVNPQTMQDGILRNIGRMHTVNDVGTAVEAVKREGFHCLNMDLIAGLPGDNANGFTQSLNAVAAFQPENITVHTLARKRGSQLDDGVFIPPPEPDVKAMLDASIGILGRQYNPYYLYRQKFMAGAFENTGWAIPGYECLYNIVMMDELRTVIGIGAGAVSKLHHPNQRIERKANHKFPQDYIRNAGV